MLLVVNAVNVGDTAAFFWPAPQSNVVSADWTALASLGALTS